VSRFLADENIPLVAVRALRAAGHDVAAVAEDGPGSMDAALLIRCRAEQRILVTFDRGFGALVYQHKVATPEGVVLLRLVPQAPHHVAEILLGLASRTDLQLNGRFTIVSRERLRQRPLPR